MTYAELMPPIGALRPDEVDHEAELALIHALDDHDNHAGNWPGPDLAIWCGGSHGPDDCPDCLGGMH